jgi:Tfp pilus assembly protein PilN
MRSAALDLNLATRPLRNRRLFAAAVRGLAGLAVAAAALAAFSLLKYGGEATRLRTVRAESARTQAEAVREDKRLTADIRQAERTNRARIELVNGIIFRKSYSWTGLLTELEKALPGPSYITALTPSFKSDGAVAMNLRVTSRSLEDLLAFIDGLTARGFKDIQVFGETRSEDGRLITEISLTHERPL